MNKTDALKIIIDAAKYYHDNLENQRLLVIYEKDKNMSYIEAIFISRNFLHLTGVKILNKNIKSSLMFYSLCLKNKLKISDFEFSKDGTTIMKLKNLNSIIKFPKSAKMIGDYVNCKKYLNTEKLIGNVFGVIGFIENNGYYIPNTLLNEDIREVTISRNRILAILKRNRNECKYKNIIYIAKDVKIDRLIKDKIIKNKIEKEIRLS